MNAAAWSSGKEQENRVLGEFVKNMHMLIGQLHEKRHVFLEEISMHASTEKEKSHKYDLWTSHTHTKCMQFPRKKKRKNIAVLAFSSPM